MVSKKKSTRQQGRGNATVITPTASEGAGNPTEASHQEATSRQEDSKTRRNDLSALEAAEKVLARKQEPMSCKELIATMALKGLWTSPRGATPWATLYAAMTREIQTRGKEARFVKVGRGRFAFNPASRDSAITRTGKGKHDQTAPVEPTSTEPTPPVNTEENRHPEESPV